MGKEKGRLKTLSSAGWIGCALIFACVVAVQVLPIWRALTARARNLKGTLRASDEAEHQQREHERDRPRAP